MMLHIKFWVTFTLLVSTFVCCIAVAYLALTGGPLDVFTASVTTAVVLVALVVCFYPAYTQFKKIRELSFTRSL